MIRDLSERSIRDPSDRQIGVSLLDYGQVELMSTNLCNGIQKIGLKTITNVFSITTMKNHAFMINRIHMEDSFFPSLKLTEISLQLANSILRPTLPRSSSFSIV